jgi:hypothetical protein
MGPVILGGTVSLEPIDIAPDVPPDQPTVDEQAGGPM